MPALLRQRGKRRVVILGAGGDLLRCYHAMLTPWLVVPSYDRIFQVLSLGRVWQLPWDWLAADGPAREDVVGRFAGVQGCRFWLDGFSPSALEFLGDG